MLILSKLIYYNYIYTLELRKPDGNMVLILLALVLLPIAFPALTLQLAGFISIWVLNCDTIWSMIMHAMIGALPFFFPTFRFHYFKELLVKYFYRIYDTADINTISHSSELILLFLHKKGILQERSKEHQ